MTNVCMVFSLSVFRCVRFLLLSTTQHGMRRFLGHVNVPTGQTLQAAGMEGCMHGFGFSLDA